MRTRAITLLLVGLLAAAGCSREARDWRSAEAADTVEAYDGFLQRHPEGERALQARARIAQLAEARDWERASAADSVAAYRLFLSQHPGGKWSQEARIRLESFALEESAAQPLPLPAPVEASARVPPVAQAVPEPPAEADTQVAPAVSPVPQSAPPQPPSVAPASMRASGYGIQLGAFSTEAQARSEWRRLRTRFGAQLGALEPRIAAADAAGRRVYRLQAPVASEARARELCGALRRQSQGCVPVLPDSR